MFHRAAPDGGALLNSVTRGIVCAALTVLVYASRRTLGADHCGSTSAICARTRHRGRSRKNNRSRHRRQPVPRVSTLGSRWASRLARPRSTRHRSRHRSPGRRRQSPNHLRFGKAPHRRREISDSRRQHLRSDTLQRSRCLLRRRAPPATNSSSLKTRPATDADRNTYQGPHCFRKGHGREPRRKLRRSHQAGNASARSRQKISACRRSARRAHHPAPGPSSRARKATTPKPNRSSRLPSMHSTPRAAIVIRSPPRPSAIRA